VDIRTVDIAVLVVRTVDIAVLVVRTLVARTVLVIASIVVIRGELPVTRRDQKGKSSNRRR
jgi:hypothetical protein